MLRKEISRQKVERRLPNLPCLSIVAISPRANKKRFCHLLRDRDKSKRRIKELQMPLVNLITHTTTDPKIIPPAPNNKVKA